MTSVKRLSSRVSLLWVRVRQFTSNLEGHIYNCRVGHYLLLNVSQCLKEGEKNMCMSQQL